MKTVVVTQRVDSYPDRNERRDALDQRLLEFLMVAGYRPIAIPNCLTGDTVVDSGGGLDAWLEGVNPHAILLSGGNDIGLCLDRDAVEKGLLDYALDNKLPALGICRGMQMMGVWAGTSLIQVDGHINTRHRVVGEINSVVNSYHGYVLSECPKNFKVLATTQSEHIEAIRHVSLSWEGWMWHPEREEVFSQSDIRRVQLLFG